MPQFDFIWTPRIVQHIADNDVTTQDFEEVVRDPDEIALSFSTGRPVAFGYAKDGRYIMCVYEYVDVLQVLPVTAYEVNR